MTTVVTRNFAGSFTWIELQFIYKPFRGWQHPRPAEIRKREQWLSVWPFQIVVRLMVHCITPPYFRPWCDFLTLPHMSHHPSDPVQDYHLKFQSSLKRTKISRARPFSIAICFMVLCIMAPNCRPIAEILRDRAVTSSLRPAQAYHGKLQFSQKLAAHDHFIKQSVPWYCTPPHQMSGR